MFQYLNQAPVFFTGLENLYQLATDSGSRMMLPWVTLLVSFYSPLYATVFSLLTGRAVHKKYKKLVHLLQLGVERGVRGVKVNEVE